MDAGFINLTPENLDGEHLCCIIRSKKAHPGVEAKRQWLADRLKEGHIFRKLNAKATVFIEYAPLETAWTPVLGDSYYYIYCLWVCGESKGKGYGRALMEYCLADARAKGKSGVCMLNSVYTRSGQNSTPNSNATNLHSSQKRCCSFCISSSNASPTFQVQKSIFHQMTKPIQVTVILPLLLAISFSRNDDIHSSISGISNDLIGVIPTIGQ